MDRRRFLEALIVGASALAIDPERLLWTPGTKAIFIPREPIKTVDWKIDYRVVWLDSEMRLQCLDGKRWVTLASVPAERWILMF